MSDAEKIVNEMLDYPPSPSGHADPMEFRKYLDKTGEIADFRARRLRQIRDRFVGDKMRSDTRKGRTLPAEAAFQRDSFEKADSEFANKIHPELSKHDLMTNPERERFGLPPRTQ